MNGNSISCSFDMALCPCESIVKFLLRRREPRWLRPVAGVCAAAGGLLAWLMVSNLPSIWMNTYGWLVLPIGGIIALSLYLGHIARRKLRVSIFETPALRGRRIFTMTPEQISLTSEFARFDFPWKHILEILEFRETALFVVGVCEFLPVPVAAFENRAAFDDFLANAKKRHAAAQETT